MSWAIRTACSCEHLLTSSHLFTYWAFFGLDPFHRRTVKNVKEQHGSAIFRKPRTNRIVCVCLSKAQSMLLNLQESHPAPVNLNYMYIYIPAPGLPRVCFVMFSRVFMMTFMFISWYLQDLWSNHHLFWSQNVVNSIVFHFFIIFHWYLHAFVNARSRKRLFQDALFFDGFAFRHRKTTKKLDFSLFFWRSSFTACSLEESRLSNGSDWHRHCFPSAIAIVWRTATTVGSVLRLCELQCC